MPAPLPDVITMAWEVIQAAIRNGADPLKALWIVSFESTWKPTARNVTPWEDSVGLFQLNVKNGMGVTAIAQGIPVLDQNGQPITDWDAIKVQIDWVTKQMARKGYTDWTVYTGKNPAGIAWPGDRRTAVQKIAERVPPLRDIAAMFVDWAPSEGGGPRWSAGSAAGGGGGGSDGGSVQSGAPHVGASSCTPLKTLYGALCSLPPPVAWLPGCDSARQCLGGYVCRQVMLISAGVLGIVLIVGGILLTPMNVQVIMHSIGSAAAGTAGAAQE